MDNLVASQEITCGNDSDLDIKHTFEIEFQIAKATRANRLIEVVSNASRTCPIPRRAPPPQPARGLWPLSVRRSPPTDGFTEKADADDDVGGDPAHVDVNQAVAGVMLVKHELGQTMMKVADASDTSR